MEELFRLMEQLPDEMLERVQRAERWKRGAVTLHMGSDVGCLIQHAVNMYDTVMAYPEFFEKSGLNPVDVYSAFDPLAHERGADAVGRECSAKAAEILAARRAATRGAVEA